MPAPEADGRSRRLVTCVAAALTLQLTAAAGAVAGPWAVASPSQRGQPSQSAPPALPAPAAVAPIIEAPARATTQAPVSLAAPELWSGTVTALPLGLDDRGSLEVPATEAELGWWRDGPRPGEIGAAVVVGHVDLDGRLGVFSRLASAQPGTIVLVTGRNGVPVRFRVTQVESYAKSHFPTDSVYRPTDRAELRLITCGGRFDPRTGHYADNVVVRAVRG